MILAVRGVGLPVLASFVGAVPIGMLGLGVLMAVRVATGSFAAAGVAAGAFSVGNALGLVLQGRLIGRWGQTRPLVTAAVLCPAVLLALTAVVERRGSPILMSVLAAAAGAGIPATTTSMRVLWPTLVTDPRLRTTAYALLATQFQIAMVTGPLLVAGLSLVAGAATVLLVAGGLAGGAGLLFAAAPASRDWRPPPASRDWRPPPAGPADRIRPTSAGLRTLVVGCAGCGTAGGLLTVGIAATAAGQHIAALAGLVFAAFSAGELVGGIAYGGRAWRWSPANRLLTAQVSVAVSTGCLAPLTGAPLLMLPAMFVVGICIAPMSITSSALLDDVAPAGSLARGYTVMVAAGLLGAAVGSSVGGILDRVAGHSTVFALAAVTVAVAAGWTRVRRPTLTVAAPEATAVQGPDARS